MTGLCFFTELMLLKRLPHNCLLARSHYGFHSLFVLTNMQRNFPKEVWIFNLWLSVRSHSFFWRSSIKRKESTRLFFFLVCFWVHLSLFLYTDGTVGELHFRYCEILWIQVLWLIQLRCFILTKLKETVAWERTAQKHPSKKKEWLLTQHCVGSERFMVRFSESPILHLHSSFLSGFEWQKN